MRDEHGHRRDCGIRIIWNVYVLVRQLVHVVPPPCMVSLVRSDVVRPCCNCNCCYALLLSINRSLRVVMVVAG